MWVLVLVLILLRHVVVVRTVALIVAIVLLVGTSRDLLGSVLLATPSCSELSLGTLVAKPKLSSHRDCSEFGSLPQSLFLHVPSIGLLLVRMPVLEQPQVPSTA